MLYVIQKGNYYTSKRNPEEIIYLVCSVKELSEKYDEMYFSDGHATSNFSRFYDISKLNELFAILDYEAIKSKKWSGEDIDTDLKRKKEAEFLIKNDIPPEFIIAFGCYNEKAKQKLITFGVSENKIKIIPQAYY